MLNTIDHGNVRELQLARPPVNALDPELVDTLTKAVAEAATAAGAIVISGREGLFSAGLDVPALLALDRAGMTGFWGSFFRLLETVARSPVPVAAAITGHSPAGGAVLSLYCDYRVMTRGEYRIGLNETRVGLVVPPVIRVALERLTGPHRAERLVVAGDLIGPNDALACGMVDALADSPQAAVSDAVRWCEGLLALPAHAMLGNRALARAALHRHFDHLGEDDVAAFVDGWFQADTQRTLKALVEQLQKKSAG